jgi:hypothetical protein
MAQARSRRAFGRTIIRGSGGRRGARRGATQSHGAVYTAAMSSVGLAAAMAGLVASRARFRRSRAARRSSGSSVARRARRAVRERVHELGMQERYAQGRARGVLYRVMPQRHDVPSDAQLEDRVRSMMFRDPLVPKRDIMVTADRGMVTLAGRVRTARMAQEIERRAAAIPDVEAVRNLLAIGHENGSTAPQER